MNTARSSIRKRAVPALTALLVGIPWQFNDEARSKILEGLKGAERLVDARLQRGGGPVGVRGAGHDLPEQRMVVVATAVVPVARGWGTSSTGRSCSVVSM